MGKKREHMTVEECKAQVEQEIPYEVGNGTSCIQRRSRRLKELYRRHGHEVVNPMQVGGFSGPRDFGPSNGHRIDVRSSDPARVVEPNIHYRGQRVA